MKMKFQVGQDFDMLNLDEMRQALAESRTDWANELIRGVKFVRIVAKTTTSGGAWQISSTNSADSTNRLGPAPGMVWGVSRIAVSGAGLVLGTDLFSLFLGDPAPSTLVESGLTRGRVFGSSSALVLAEGDRLGFQGLATGGGTDVTVSGAAIELPYMLAWQLL